MTGNGNDRDFKCWHCRSMASHDAINRPRVPKDGDASICLNCGASSVRSGAGWRPMQFYEFAELPVETRGLLDQLLAGRPRRTMVSLPGWRSG
jgi:hypothetical protein